MSRGVAFVVCLFLLFISACLLGGMVSTIKEAQRIPATKPR